jgi:hypothetical protein
MLLAFPTEILIFIVLFVLLILGIIAAVFYAAATKAANQEELEAERGRKDAAQEKPRGGQSSKEQARRSP